jgi:hypothetical protein
MFGIGGGELVFIMFIVLMLLVLIKFQRWHAPWESDGAIKKCY